MASFMVNISGRYSPAMAMITNAVSARYRGGFMSVNAALQQCASAGASALAGFFVTRDSQGNGQAVAVEFTRADADTLRDVTGKAIDKQLALLLDGKVLSAATVEAPITARMVMFAFGTASAANQFATELGAPATS